MTDNWIRYISLIISPVATGDSLDLSDMHIVFQIRQSDVQSPNSAVIRVYNLSERTLNRIRQFEFSRVVLTAGYAQNYARIFKGELKQIRIGHENATDSYVDLLCADGDLGYNFGAVRETLASGATPEQQYKAIVKSSTDLPRALETGYTPFQDGLVGGTLPRGKVLYGMARDTMRALAYNMNADWSIQNGKVQIVPKGGYIPSPGVVLTAATGLIESHVKFS